MENRADAIVPTTNAAYEPLKKIVIAARAAKSKPAST